MPAPMFCVSCIDYRFDILTAEYFKSIGRGFDFFSSTTAGGALALGSAICSLSYKSPEVMELFKETLVTNLRVALTLQPVTEVILMNHQDCGAFKAFLPYVGYPESLGQDNVRELEIQADILTLAHTYIRELFPDLLVQITLIDVNGAVAEYNINQKVWTLVFEGSGRASHQLKEGLWFGMKPGDMTQL